VLHCERPAFHATVAPRYPDILDRLAREAAKKQAAGVAGQVLLSFTGDPYCRADMDYALTREAIKILHGAGFSVCTLTKGGTRALRDLDLFTPADAFATTLTWGTHWESEEWEPGAAGPMERINTLIVFHVEGIPTWVSLEPVVNPEAALAYIHAYHNFVDFWKVGTWNYSPQAKEIDWAAFAVDVVKALRWVGARYLIKADLAKYLPAGVAAEWRG